MYNDTIDIDNNLEIEIIREAMDLYVKDLENTVENLIKSSELHEYNDYEKSSVLAWSHIKRDELKIVRELFKDGIPEYESLKPEQCYHIYFAVSNLKERLDKNTNFNDFINKSQPERLKILYEEQTRIGKKLLCNEVMKNINHEFKLNKK